MADFNNTKKQHLISVWFSLEYVADGVSQFVDDKFLKLHRKLSSKMSSLDLQPCNNSCSKTYGRNTSAWCNTCSMWQTCILSEHTHRAKIGKSGADWTKIDSSQWPHLYKEVEMCFNPEWCFNMKGSANTTNDISVIIGKIINCYYIAKKFSKYNINPLKIREIRNKTAHYNEITVSEKEDYCDEMMTFLKCPKVWIYEEAKKSHINIEIFKKRNCVDIVKEEIIKENEMEKLKERIAKKWGKCQTVSLMTVVIVFLAITTPPLYLGILEVMKTHYFAEISFLLNRFIHNSVTSESMACENVTIVSRREWSGRLPKQVQKMSTPVDNVFVHHTAWDFCEGLYECASRVRSVQHVHMDQNGWDDCGYSFLIGEDGRAYECRGWDRVGAHTKGWNDKCLSFSFMGNFNERKANNASMTTLQNIIQCGVLDGKILPQYKLYGHRDARPTESPGHYLYKQIQQLDHYYTEAYWGHTQKYKTQIFDF